MNSVKYKFDALTLACALAALCVTGCDDGGGAADGGAADGGAADGGANRFDAAGGGDDAAVRTLRAASFNVGLARGFVPYAAERVAPAAAAIAQLDADVICLQEVWAPEDVAAVTAAARERYPYSFSAAPDPGVCGACGPEESATLEACVRARCPDDLDDPVGCALSACEAEVNAISESCLVCLSANIGGSLDTLLDACAGETAACFAYGGSYGTLLLSKRPLQTPTLTTWSSSINRRGVLAATIATDRALDPVAAPALHVYCTHLSAIFNDIPYPGAGPDGDSPAAWAAEQRAQIDLLHQQIDDEAGEGPVLVLGDFNTGPAVPEHNVMGEYTENFDALAVGYGVPYVSDVGRCTYCSEENPLIGGGVQGGEGGVLIDHILLRGFDPAARTFSQRILDATITLETQDGPVQSRDSDHYGIQVSVSAN